MFSTLPCPCWENPRDVPGSYQVLHPPALHPAPRLRLVCRMSELSAKIREHCPAPTASPATAAASLPYLPPLS